LNEKNETYILVPNEIKNAELLTIGPTIRPPMKSIIHYAKHYYTFIASYYVQFQHFERSLIDNESSNEFNINGRYI